MTEPQPPVPLIPARVLGESSYRYRHDPMFRERVEAGVQVLLTDTHFGDVVRDLVRKAVAVGVQLAQVPDGTVNPNRAVLVGGHRDGELHDDLPAGLPQFFTVMTEAASRSLRAGERVEMPVPTMRYVRTADRDLNGRTIYRPEGT